MSVRRLADDAVQPKDFAFTKANAAFAKAAIKKFPEGRQASAVIPLLMRAQEQEGWVSRAAIEHIADMLGMARIRVLEVATFYTQFQLKPVGTRAHVQVCGTTPCMLRGSEDLIRVCKSRIHAEPFHTNKDGSLSWEEVECLGACVNAPMVMIGKDAYEDLTPQRLEEIIHAFEVGKGDTIKPGPQNGRWFAEAATGRTTLKDEKAVLKVTRDKASKAAAKAVAAPPPPVAAAKSAPAVVAKPVAPAAPKADKSASVGLTATKPAPAAPVAKAAFAPKAEKTAPIAPKTASSTVARSADARPVAPAAVSSKTDVRPVKPSALPSAAQLMAKPVAPVRPTKPSALPSAAELMARAAARPKTAPAKKAKPAAAPAKATGEKKPELIAKPRAGKGDDLKLIWGVGPKLEKMLNAMGVWHFNQIASWGKAELAWVDERLEGFKGRASRDEWVKQAKKLATGWRPDNAVGDKPV
ncbi:MAG: NADH-quinone oxidoreductase subunit NuoE [Phyllobacteriaceae bacterium]|nr:NADH-quinone oxidoreductase subunit NuoE [Phyllobacteriaceae bacterium]